MGAGPRFIPVPVASAQPPPSIDVRAGDDPDTVRLRNLAVVGSLPAEQRREFDELLRDRDASQRRERQRQAKRRNTDTRGPLAHPTPTHDARAAYREAIRRSGLRAHVVSRTVDLFASVAGYANSSFFYDSNRELLQALIDCTSDAHDLRSSTEPPVQSNTFGVAFLRTAAQNSNAASESGSGSDSDDDARRRRRRRNRRRHRHRNRHGHTKSASESGSESESESESESDGSEAARALVRTEHERRAPAMPPTPWTFLLTFCSKVASAMTAVWQAHVVDRCDLRRPTEDEALENEAVRTAWVRIAATAFFSRRLAMRGQTRHEINALNMSIMHSLDPELIRALHAARWRSTPNLFFSTLVRAQREAENRALAAQSFAFSQSSGW